MTRKEAVKWLESLKREAGKTENRTLWHYAESIDMAIEALSAEPVVSADPIIDEKTIYCSPKIARDVEVVVRCKDCRWAEKAILDEYCVECTMYHTSSMKHGYCHHGERREEDDK